jgi:hypothetical protein
MTTEKLRKMVSDMGHSVVSEKNSVIPMPAYDALLAMKIRGFKRISRERKDGRWIEVWAKRIKK